MSSAIVSISIKNKLNLYAKEIFTFILLSCSTVKASRYINLQLDFWHEGWTYQHIFVAPNEQPVLMKRLTDAAIEFIVKHDNIQRSAINYDNKK